MDLADSRLLRGECYVDGRWQAADDGRTLAVSDPASALVIGEVPLMGAVESGRAIAAAAAALPPGGGRRPRSGPPCCAAGMI
jgi:succinate-semialdehyde dehydrogenase/glutarate-semialdehyde dehydrogenase